MILNFRHLEVFRAIMVAKTVSGAAELLHVSQPGISRVLKYMEYKLGIDLFERRKGRLIPTPEGEELLRELDPIYQRLEDLDFALKRITRTDNMEFRIACTPSLANYVMPWLLSRAKEKMPGITVQLESLPNEEISNYIAQRRIDFALAFYSPSHPLLLGEPTINVGLECVVRADHPLASRKSVTYKDMMNYEMVTFYPETLLGSWLVRAAAEVNQEPRVNAVVRYADDACNMVEQGLGITIAFQYTALPQRYPSLVRIPVKSERQRLHFLRHAGVSMSNNVRKFYELAKSEIKSIQ